MNINDMYNNDVGKGAAQGCEAIVIVHIYTTARGKVLIGSIVAVARLERGPCKGAKP
jgi:hypothetical protein